MKLKLLDSIGNILSGRQRTAGGYIQQSKIDSTVTFERALKNPTVVSCLTVIANAIAQSRFCVADSENKMADRINETLENPNPYQNHFTLIYGIVWDMLLYGNAYLIMTKSENKRLVMLAPIDPQRVHIKVDKIGMPSYLIDGINGFFPSDRIVHFRDGGSHEVVARSRISAAGKRIRSLDFADQRIGNTFKNGLDFQYVMTLENKVGADEMNKHAEDLKKLFGPGGKARGGVAVIQGGTLEKMEGLKPADADLRQLREDLIREIAAIYAVPPFLVGGTGDTKYNNVTARIVAMYREALSPIITNMEQTLSKSIGVKIKANREALLLGDLPSQIAAGIQAAGGPIMTTNEVRTLIMELPELSDGVAGELRDSMPATDTGDRRGEMPTDNGNVVSING